MPRLLCLLFVLSLAACSRESAHPEPSSDKSVKAAADQPVLKTYRVPPQRARDLNAALASLKLANGSEESALQVRLLGDSTLVVLAPDSLHPSIERAIDDAVKNAPAEAAIGAAKLDFWVLDEEPEGKPVAALEPALLPVAESIRAEFGAASLVLADSAGMVVVTDERAQSTTGNGFRYMAGLSSWAQGLRLETTVVTDSTELHTTVPVELGKFAVLAQLGTRGQPLRKRYVVLRASAVGAAD